MLYYPCKSPTLYFLPYGKSRCVITIKQNSMPLQFSSRSHKILFWSLLVLAVAMVLAVAFALRGFNREMGKEDMSLKTSNSPQGGETTVPLSEAMTEEILMGWKRDANQHIVITGTATNVHAIPEQKDIQGAELDLMVSPVVDPAIYPAPDKVYHFFLSERDTEGFAQTMKAGDRLTVTVQSAPMEDAYVIATKVEKGEGMMEKN